MAARFPKLHEQRSCDLAHVQRTLLTDIEDIDVMCRRGTAGERDVLHALILLIDLELRFRNGRRKPARVTERHSASDPKGKA